MGPSKKILIIEDEKDTAALLSKRLKAAGYEILITPDVTFGISESHQFKPDLIILDLMLPGGGGLAVLNNLKISIFTEHIPILVLTGLQDEDVKKKVLLASSVKAYLQKPYKAEELLGEIKGILGEEKTGQTAGKGKILVVDDEAAIRKSLETRLAANGYSVLTAADGEEALQLTHSQHPDLILIDLMLPKIDGWRVCQQLKTDANFKHVPIIILSGLLQEDDDQPDVELADAYLAKPFQPEQLLATVKKLLKINP